MPTPKPKFNNGDIVRDTVTTFEGMIVGTTLWLNGCYRYVIQSRTLNKDGVPPTPESVDEMQLELVKNADKEGDHGTGGPRPTPSRW